MRTARLLAVSPSMHCSWGGMSPPGGCGIPACTEADPPTVDRMTDTCKNITFANFAGGNDVIDGTCKRIFIWLKHSYNFALSPWYFVASGPRPATLQPQSTRIPAAFHAVTQLRVHPDQTRKLTKWRTPAALDPTRLPASASLRRSSLQKS